MKRIIYLFLLLVVIFLLSCQNDSNLPNQTVNNPYAGKWLFTIVTAYTSSDTVTIASDGNFTSTRISLRNLYSTTYTGSASGSIDNAATFNAAVSYIDPILPLVSTISGYTGASGNYTITLLYNNIPIGSADGSISNTTYTGSGTFTSPLFNGNWSARKLN